MGMLDTSEDFCVVSLLIHDVVDQDDEGDKHYVERS